MSGVAAEPLSELERRLTRFARCGVLRDIYASMIYSGHTIVNDVERMQMWNHLAPLRLAFDEALYCSRMLDTRRHTLPSPGF